MVRARGLVVAFLGVLAVSPDAMLLRSMRALGASSADVAAAKYVGIFLFMVGFGVAKGVRGALVSPGHFAVAACCQMANQLCFTFSLLLTDAARALLLISLTPLWAALLGVVVLREPLPLRTRCALVCSVLAILVVFTPKLFPMLSATTQPGGAHARVLHPVSPADAAAEPTPVAPTGLSSSYWMGDVLAAGTGLAQAASLTVNRHAALHAPSADIMLATGVSSVCAGALVLTCVDTRLDLT
jgi:drug/metabolite transporter (DMT)-like permease